MLPPVLRVSLVEVWESMDGQASNRWPADDFDVQSSPVLSCPLELSILRFDIDMGHVLSMLWDVHVVPIGWSIIRFLLFTGYVGIQKMSSGM